MGEAIVEQLRTAAKRAVYFGTGEDKLLTAAADALEHNGAAPLETTNLDLSELRRIAEKSVPADDGYSYLVPAADIATLSRGVLSLLDHVERGPKAWVGRWYGQHTVHATCGRCGWIGPERETRHPAATDAASHTCA